MSIYGPGSFESFKLRPDNQGLSDRQIQLKYEQALFESQQLMELIYDQQQATREQQIQQQVQNSSNLSGQIPIVNAEPSSTFVDPPAGFFEIYEVDTTIYSQGSIGSIDPGYAFDTVGSNGHEGALAFPVYDNGDAQNVSTALGGNYVEMGDIFVTTNTGLSWTAAADLNYDLYPIIDASNDSLSIYYADSFSGRNEPSWKADFLAVYNAIENGDVSLIKVYVNDDNPNYFVGTY